MLNPMYTDELLEKAGEHFKKQNHIQLLNFLSKDVKLPEFKWSHEYVPLEFSFSFSQPLVFAKDLLPVIRKIVGKKVNFELLEFRSFEHGDYSVLHDKLKPGKGYAIFLDLNSFDESWGGFTVFMKGDEEFLRLVPQANSLFIINQSGLRSFTKYVNNRARHPRVFLYAVLQ